MNSEAAHPLQRPPGWLCPWCDRDEQGEYHPERGGQAVDFTLPLELRICWGCANPPLLHPRLPTESERQLIERRESLRAILRRHLRESFVRRSDGEVVLSAKGHTSWAWLKAGAALVGNTVLGAMTDAGLDAQAELQAAVQDRLPNTNERTA